MPAFKVSDQFGLNLNVTPSPQSAFTKYFRDAVDAVVHGFDLSRLSGLDLKDPAITSLQAGLTFDQPAGMRVDGAGFEVAGGIGGTLGIFVPGPDREFLFSPDDYGDNIPVSADERYVSLGLTATGGISGGVDAGSVAFGFEPGTSFEIVNYRKFSTRPSAPTLASALTTTVQSFSMPGSVEDLAEMPDGSVVALNGRGALRFTTSANLLAIANPLATVSLPGGAGALSVKAGGSVDVSASFQVSCEYQIRVQKLGPNRIRLGYYKKHASEATIGATVRGGLSAGVGGFDIFSTVIQALSSDPEADKAALQSAGLPPSEVDAIEEAVKAGIERKLEIAVGAELASLDSKQAAFLYEIELEQLDAGSRQDLQRALRGDLSGLTQDGKKAAGITHLRSISSTIRERSLSLRINLLGIYNFSSISKLTLSGTVVFEPVTGDLVITDSATASRIQAARVPFRAEPQRLRKVLAESFLITAAYRGGKSVAAAPTLTSGHTFFELNAKTNRQTMGDDLEVAVALGLVSNSEEAAILGALDDFGPTTFYAETRYDDELTAGLFLSGGQPRSLDEYERAGREAIQLLVRPVDIDEYRRRPAIDDTLWARMKSAGQANFKPLLPGLSAEQVSVIAVDYSVIVWWAATMRKTAEKLAALRNLLDANPNLSWDDNRFKTMRADLAKHLQGVARDTKEEFGRPWGLIAMDRVSGRAAEATVQMTGSRVALLKERPRAISAAAGADRSA